MSNLDKLDRVPPYLPLIWEDWDSDPDINSMGELQIGIYIQALVRQWQLGSLPRRAWDFRRKVGLKCSYDTTRRFLTTYSHLFVCCECGRSWTEADCECGVTGTRARTKNTKLHFLRNEAKTGTALGTTEPEPKPQPKPKPNRTEHEVPPPSPPSPSKPRQGVSKQGSFETETADQDGTPAQAKEETPDANPVSRKFMDALFSLGRKEFKNGASRDACNAAFEGLLRTESPAHVLNVIEYILQNEVYARGLRTIERMEPWDWFVEKFDGMVNQMNADEEFAAKRKKRLEKEAPKIPANAPEYRKNPTGREFLKPSDL